MTEHEEFMRRATARPAAKAPYTFVETGQKVLESPHEALNLSRPVTGALSGKLTVKWTAKTPLLVGGGNATDENPDNATPLKIGDRYALPGSTLKGLVRATMEIAAFARLSFVEDFTGHTHSYMDETWKKEIRPAQSDHHTGGWLFRTENGYKLVQAARTEKIKIDDFLPLDTITSAQDWHKASMHSRQTAILAGDKQGVCPASSFGQDGDETAQLVVAGQTADTDRDRKQVEYLFFWPEPARPIDIDKDTGDRFLASLHKDSNAHEGDPEANYTALITTGGITGFSAETPEPLETQLEKPALYGLPVFWRNPCGGNQEHCTNKPVLSLTALYRVPFRKTVHDLIAETQSPLDDDKLDLVQALLGWAPPQPPTTRIAERKKTQKPLRSRVRFGFAYSDNACMQTQTKTWAAGKPKPSYWPYYLKANSPEATHPVDYNNPNAILAGRKRYPARGQAGQLHGDPERSDRNQELTFLEPGADFTSDIRFHNISEIELGALVFAITFGDLDKTGKQGFFHMIGRAKAHGYGQVKAAITGNTITVHRGDKVTLDSALASFAKWVGGGIGTAFNDIHAIRRLKGTAHADTGADLRTALGFPQANGKAGESGGQKVLNAYGKLKKRAQEAKGGIGGQTIAETEEIGLPPYPGVPKA